MIIDPLLGLRSTSDGWRATIADGFTFSNLRRLTAAAVRYARSMYGAKPRVLVGYDCRFMGRDFAEVVCDAAVREGADCSITDSPVPTPVLSWFSRDRGYQLGLMVTASHNPASYNGLKIRIGDGGPPTESTMRTIEDLIPAQAPSSQHWRGGIDVVSPIPPYVEALRGGLCLQAIDAAGLTVAVDAMHGVTAGLLRRVLAGTCCRVLQVRGRRDPLFGGVAPEPKACTLGPLFARIRGAHCDLGMAHDGDGDRIVAVDPERGYVSPHDLTCALAFALPNWGYHPGSLVASVSVTRRVRDVAAHLGRSFHEVSVGFRYAADVMRREKVFIAGEENGGIGLGSHLPDRDGTMVAARLIELLSMSETSLGSILSAVDQVFGPSCVERLDVPLSLTRQTDLAGITAALSTAAPGNSATGITHLDGTKFAFADGSWLLVRVAGTEPVIRLYAESHDMTRCRELLERASATIRQY